MIYITEERKSITEDKSHANPSEKVKKTNHF